MQVSADDKRYELRSDEYGTWSVIDERIDFPVVIGNRLLICLDEQEARDAAELMNMADRMRSPPISAAPPVPSKRHPFLDPIR